MDNMHSVAPHSQDFFTFNMEPRFSTEARQALAADFLLVTPNNRMARTLVRAHDAAQRASGLAIWPTAQALPYAAFVERLWRQLATAMPLPRRLNARAGRRLWAEIIEQDAEAALYATVGATTLAQESWRLMHLWRDAADETPWRQWRREGGGVTHDTARFARWAARYHERLAGLPVIRQFVPESTVSALHLYVIELDNTVRRTRAEIFAAMRSAGIGVNVHYIPVHLQPWYRRLGFSRGDYPVAEAYYDRALTLPLHPNLSVEQQDQVIEALSLAIQT